MKMLGRLGMPTELWRLVDQHLPARGLEVSPLLYGQALISLVAMGSRPDESPETRAAAKDIIPRLLALIDNKGIYNEDYILSSRLFLKTSEGVGPSGIVELYHGLRRTRLKGAPVGPETRTTMIDALLRVGALQEAIEVLGWTDGTQTLAHANDYKPTLGLLAVLERSNWSPSWPRIRRLIVSQPSDNTAMDDNFKIQVMMALLDEQAAHLQHQGRDGLSVNPSHVFCPGGAWMNLASSTFATTPTAARAVALSLVLTRRSYRHQTNAIDAQAGLDLLRYHVANPAVSQQRGRLQRLASMFAYHVIRSTKLSASQRHYHVSAMLEIVQANRPFMPDLFVDLAIFHLKRRELQRDQSQQLSAAPDEDLEMALYWFRWARSIRQKGVVQDVSDEVPIRTAHWARMMAALKEAGRQDGADELLREAYGFVDCADGTKRRRVPLDQPLWDAAKRDGSLDRVGISSIDFLMEKHHDMSHALFEEDEDEVKDGKAGSEDEVETAVDDSDMSEMDDDAAFDDTLDGDPQGGES